MWEQEDIKPLCQQSVGCPISDVAPDLKITRRISKFLNYRSLTIVNAPESLRIQLLKEADLFENPNLLVSAEQVARNAENLKKERERGKNGNRSRRK